MQKNETDFVFLYFYLKDIFKVGLSSCCCTRWWFCFLSIFGHLAWVSANRQVPFGCTWSLARARKYLTHLANCKNVPSELDNHREDSRSHGWNLLEWSQRSWLGRHRGNEMVLEAACWSFPRRDSPKFFALSLWKIIKFDQKRSFSDQIPVLRTNVRNYFTPAERATN